MSRIQFSLARKLSLCLVGGALFSTWGCSTDDSSGSLNNSQTHWLSVCSEDADCGELSCICGICTDECGSGDSCSGFSAEAKCASANENGACETGAPEKVCLAQCEDDGDCSNGATCGQGVCSPEAPSGSSPVDPEPDTGGGGRAAQDGGPLLTPPMPPIPADGGNSSGGSVPPGVDCDAYSACGAGEDFCADGVNCIAIVGCPTAICIDAEEACGDSCPDPTECSIGESFPEQLFCEGRIPGYSSDPADGGMCVPSGKTGCGNGSSCCDGLECCEGIPYPADGQCGETCLLKSDRSVKHDVRPVDARKVLDKVSELQIGTWSYDADPGVRHLGPMAQDFKASFELGGSDRAISTVDAVGVALTAIQALNERVEALERENAALRAAALRLESR